MKNTSFFLTISLLIPMFITLFQGLETYYAQTKLVFGVHPDHYFLWQLLSPIFISLMFFATSVYLNIREKFFENSIMCGTLLVSFILHFLLNMASSFVYFLMRGGTF